MNHILVTGAALIDALFAEYEFDVVVNLAVQGGFTPLCRVV